MNNRSKHYSIVEQALLSHSNSPEDFKMHVAVIPDNDDADNSIKTVWSTCRPREGFL